MTAAPSSNNEVKLKTKQTKDNMTAVGNSLMTVKSGIHCFLISMVDVLCFAPAGRGYSDQQSLRGGHPRGAAAVGVRCAHPDCDLPGNWPQVQEDQLQEFV